MAKETKGNTSIFTKMLEAGEAYLDSQIMKAKTTIVNSNIEEDFFFGKAVVEDPSYSLQSQGWRDKPYRVQNNHLKQMSYQDTAVSAVIQTRQSQISGYAKLVKSEQKKGWMIKLRDEDALLEKIKEELKKEMDADNAEKALAESAMPPQEGAVPPEEMDQPENPMMQKAEGDEGPDDDSMEGITDEDSDDNGKTDDEVESYNFELERKAREKLAKQFEKARKQVEEYVMNCGSLDNRPFESKKWNIESALKAWTRDSLTYDLYATETVPNKGGKPAYWFPVDGGTIKYASRDLRKYKDSATNFYNIDILYPERTKEAEGRQQAIDLNDELLAKDAYKWVQVIRGKVERAYTEDEMHVGIRNINTDIFNNGYGISELELLISMITGHLNAEYYNQAYFTQGFSAKGILHVKAALNRRKVESIRTQWHHMLKGSRNSFQTPIFAGVEDVKWIPLTQNHNDIGFEGWMRYVVTMIGAIFQIDPSEMGIHFKAEGGSGGLGSQENQKSKIDNSKDRGLFPLLKHFERYISDDIIKPIDARFVLKFTGLDGEDSLQALNRQKEEVKFKKTVNEIRAEDGLPPLPGMDDVILDAQYMAWYNSFSDKAQAKAKKDAASQQSMMGQGNLPGMEDEEGQGDETHPEEDIYGKGIVNDSLAVPPEPVKKSKKLSIEFYNLKK